MVKKKPTIDDFSIMSKENKKLAIKYLEKELHKSIPYYVFGCDFNSQMGKRIAELIKEKGITQKEAGKLLYLSQPKVSALAKGNLGITFNRLFLMLNLLGQDVEITVKPPALKKHIGYTTLIIKTTKDR